MTTAPVKHSRIAFRFGTNNSAMPTAGQKPLWITFEKDMGFSLEPDLVVTSDKTIDWRRVNVVFQDGNFLVLLVQWPALSIASP